MKANMDDMYSRVASLPVTESRKPHEDQTQRQDRKQLPISLAPLTATLPEEWLEFAPNPNRRYIEVVRGMLADDLGLLDSSDRRFDAFAGVSRYFFPQADMEAMVLSLELMCWFFYFDDPIDDGVIQADVQKLVERMVQVLVQGTLPPTPTGCERLCWQFRERSRIMAGPRIPAWNRFIEQCAAWVKSIPSISQRFASYPISIEEHARLRTINAGILPEFALNEIILGLDLDDEFVESQSVVRFGELGALVIGYFNDVYSYDRERGDQTQFNSLDLRQSRGLVSLEQAFAMQVRDVRTMVAEMMSIEMQLCANGDIGLRLEASSCSAKQRAQTRYIEGIKTIVVGNHLWSRADGRYHSPTSSFRELRDRTPDRRRVARVPNVANVAEA